MRFFLIKPQHTQECYRGICVKRKYYTEVNVQNFAHLRMTKHTNINIY